MIHIYIYISHIYIYIYRWPPSTISWRRWPGTPGPSGPSTGAARRSQQPNTYPHLRLPAARAIPCFPVFFGVFFPGEVLKSWVGVAFGIPKSRFIKGGCSGNRL